MQETSMSHANSVYTSPRLLLSASITSRVAGIWPHCLVLMKMIRLLRIFWELPGLWEGTSQEAILTARFTTGTIGLHAEGILGYARVTDARTRGTTRHVTTTTRHSRKKFWSRARPAAAAYGAYVWPREPRRGWRAYVLLVAGGLEGCMCGVRGLPPSVGRP